MGLSNDGADLALDAALDSVTTARLHTGDPGSAGTANRLGGANNDATIAFGASSDGEAVTTDTAEFSALTASGDVTHVSLWASTSFRGTATFPTRSVVSASEFTLASITMRVVPNTAT